MYRAIITASSPKLRMIIRNGMTFGSSDTFLMLMSQKKHKTHKIVGSAGCSTGLITTTQRDQLHSRPLARLPLSLSLSTSLTLQPTQLTRNFSHYSRLAAPCLIDQAS